MTRSLYFMPILAESLGEPDVRASIERAFGMIERLGQEPGYEEGYRNFCQFMTEVGVRRHLLDEHDGRMAIMECVRGVPSDTEFWKTVASTLAERDLWLEGEYDALRQVCECQSRAPILQLLRDGQLIADLGLERVPRRWAVEDIQPGRYHLVLDTGLVVWEGALTAADVIWREAFEGKELALAAEAGEVHRPPSKEVEVPNTHLVLRVFPGLESGSLEIELTS